MGPERRPTPALLKLDASAGLTVGALVIIMHTWLAGLEGIPARTLLFTGFANLLYGCYSGSLALRASRPMASIKVLAIANMAWSPVCIGLILFYWLEITGLGVAHLLAEAVFVGLLGATEWRQRDQLV